MASKQPPTTTPSGPSQTTQQTMPQTQKPPSTAQSESIATTPQPKGIFKFKYLIGSSINRI